MLDVNLFGALHVMQAAVKQMQQQGTGGHIVNVASLAGRRGFSPLGGYCASKFALVGLTEALRTELLGSNVGVSLVLPGVIDTPMAEAAALDPDDRRFLAEGAQHAGRPGSCGPSSRRSASSWPKWRCRRVARCSRSSAALAPGATDILVRGAMGLARRSTRRRTQLIRACSGFLTFLPS